MCLLFDFSPSHASCSVNAILNHPGCKLLFDFSPSHASCSVNAILNHPGCKLLSLLTVVIRC